MSGILTMENLERVIEAVGQETGKALATERARIAALEARLAELEASKAAPRRRRKAPPRKAES